jgi:hypothetical protein
MADALQQLAEHQQLQPVDPEKAQSPDFYPVNLKECLNFSIRVAKGNEYDRKHLQADMHLVGHVRLTPTGMDLEGPVPDLTNRVLRQYAQYHDHFIRVTFCEENTFNQFSNRQEDNMLSFIRERFGGA